MRVQFLLAMGQDQLSKEEVGEILNHSIHIINSTQDLRHSTQNLVHVAGEYLG